MRERAAMVDLSAFAIFDITGPAALEVVQGLALRQMDVPVAAPSTRRCSTMPAASAPI